MTSNAVYWAIIATVIIVSALGMIPIIKKSVFHYGLLLCIQAVSAVALCVLFQSLKFYRFAVPLPYILIFVATGFGLYILVLVYYRPKEIILPFFFTVLNLVFILEYFLEQYVHFITYQNGWDIWDTYTWYWVYTLAFSAIGDYVVPARYRRPLSPHSKWYWISFFLVLFVSAVFLLYVLAKR